MVFQIIKQQSKKSIPIINEPGFQGSSNFSNAQYVAERIVREIKTCPELVGILDTVVTDHFMDEIDFYSSDGFESLGPTQLKRAKKFWQENNVTQVFQGLGFDYFMGDAYAWHPSLKNQGAMKEFSNLPANFKEIIDEEGNMPRKFSYVPASTMTIKYGLTDVEYYVQNAQGKQIRYELDEITHLKLIEFNGEVNGLSGLKALAKEVAMMYMVKENIMSQLDNGGSPDSIIYLKNGQGISKAKFERLKLSLESFSHVKKSHGNLAIDGEVGVHQLGMNLKDMEYRELAMFVVSEFLLAIGLPTTRVPFLMTGSGGAANKGNLAGDSEQSYQKKVNNRRRQWENILNIQVFNKLGFSIRFRRDNLQDEVRETQATQMRYASVSELQNVLMKSGKKLKDSVLLDMLAGVKARLFEHDLEEADLDMLNPLGQEGNPNKGQTPVTNPKNNVQEANSRARVDNATNRGISS